MQKQDEECNVQKNLKLLQWVERITSKEIVMQMNENHSIMKDVKTKKQKVPIVTSEQSSPKDDKRNP